MQSQLCTTFYKSETLLCFCSQTFVLSWGVTELSKLFHRTLMPLQASLCFLNEHTAKLLCAHPPGNSKLSNIANEGLATLYSDCLFKRTSLLTGRRPDTNHVWLISPKEYWRLFTNATTIPQYFKENGVIHIVF